MESESATIEGPTAEVRGARAVHRGRGFQLTPADVEMIRSVYKYRFLHIDHVSAMTGRSYKKVHGRMLKLARNHFLGRIELPFQKHIYVVGREGINILV